MPLTKRSFASVKSISNHNETLLRQLLAHFPEYTERFSLDLSAPQLDLDAVHQLLMGDAIPEALNDLLYISNALGTSSGWQLIEEQSVRDRFRLPPFNPTYSYIDLAVNVALSSWPNGTAFLESAYACQRIHAKSSFKYYGMISDIRSNFHLPTDEGLAFMRKILCNHFIERGYIRAGEQERAVRIIQYDYVNEIWFLICYADRKKRFRGWTDEGESKNFEFNPEQYDAVVYNKVYGDIRMNTCGQRVKDHQKYRYAFGTLLFDNGGAFHPSKDVVSLAPLADSRAAELFNVDDIPNIAFIEPISLKYEAILSPLKESCTAPADSSLRVLSRFKPRLVPDEAFVTHVVFSYRLKDSKHVGKLELSHGNTIAYDRDGDSMVLEEFLRKRGFVISLFKEAGNATQQAA